MKKYILMICLFIAGGQLGWAQFAGGQGKSYTTTTAENRIQQSYGSGYKGFVEAGFSAIGWEMGWFSLYTSHGYQFSPYVFLGAGIGLELNLDWPYVPLFAEFRVNFNNPNKYKCTPYLGARVGWAAREYGGIYFNVFPGLRIPVRQNRNAIHLNMGYQLATDIEIFDYEYVHTFSFRVGFEF